MAGNGYAGTEITKEAGAAEGRNRTADTLAEGNQQGVVA